MSLLLALVASILIGYYAQASKGRTGAAWGALTLIAIAAIWFVLFMSIATADATFLDRPRADLVLGVIACALGFAFMGLIVMTLPKRPQ